MPAFFNNGDKIMKILWGLIETTTPHIHTYDGTKWKLINIVNISANFYGTAHSDGSVEYFHNTCLTCGDLIEKSFNHRINN